MAIKMISFAGIGEVACIANGICQTYCGKCAVRTGRTEPAKSDPVRTLIEQLRNIVRSHGSKPTIWLCESAA